MYYSQIGQDKFVDDFFNKKENGIFIDIGANDGIKLSNTYFLENERKWTGICIEPRKEEFLKLINNRKCKSINIAVSDFDGKAEFYNITGYPDMLSGLKQDYDPKHLERANKEINECGGNLTTTEVNVCKLQTILDEYKITNIDYCSIDVEGAELSIVKSIDFNRINIKLFSIENNYNTNDVEKYLLNWGYILHKKIEFDDIFVKQ